MKYTCAPLCAAPEALYDLNLFLQRAGRSDFRKVAIFNGIPCCDPRISARLWVFKVGGPYQGVQCEPLFGKRTDR